MSEPNPQTVLTDTILVTADKLLTNMPLAYEDRFYPLREPEWQRVTQSSISGVVVGAVLGLILTTVAPVAGNFLDRQKVSTEQLYELLFEVMLLGIAYASCFLFDRKKQKQVRKINDFFGS